MELLATVLMLAAVVALVAAPLRRGRATDGAAAGAAAAEAAREAKYREILDAELDYRTGKLAAEDFRAIDATLRAEAVELARRVDEERDPR